jgi:hypothetical protein
MILSHLSLLIQSKLDSIAADSFQLTYVSVTMAVSSCYPILFCGGLKIKRHLITSRPHLILLPMMAISHAQVSAHIHIEKS